MNPEPRSSPRALRDPHEPHRHQGQGQDQPSAHAHLTSGMLARMADDDIAKGTRRAGRMRVTPTGADRMQRDGTTTEDEKLLIRRPSPAFLDTDPWRALRILSEFVDGFDAMAAVGRGRDGLRVGPDAAGTRRTTSSPGASDASSRRPGTR